MEIDPLIIGMKEVWGRGARLGVRLRPGLRSEGSGRSEWVAVRHGVVANVAFSLQGTISAAEQSRTKTQSDRHQLRYGI